MRDVTGGSDAGELGQQVTRAPLMTVVGVLARAALVLVVTSLVWLVAFPTGHWAMRPQANQAAAVATLESIAAAQEELRALAAIDRDRDGIGEYGTFAEMSGGVPLRGTDGADTSSVLPVAFANFLEGGVVERQGFLIRIDLPAAPGDGRVRPTRVLADVDPQLAEDLWQAYAWPKDASVLGPRAFHVSADGVVREASPADSRYSGLDAAPPFDAALVASRPGDLAAPPADGVPSNDGLAWRPVRD